MGKRKRVKVKFNLFLFLIFCSFLFWGYNVSAYGKWEDKIWGIPISLACFAIMTLPLWASVFVKFISHPRRELSSIYMRLSIFGMLLCVTIGAFFQEGLSFSNLFGRDGYVDGSYEVYEKAESSTGYNNYYLQKKVENIISGFFDSDSSSDSSSDSDGEGMIIIFLIILIVIIIIAFMVLSATVPNFWVIAGIFFISLTIIFYIRKKNYEMLYS